MRRLLAGLFAVAFTFRADAASGLPEPVVPDPFGVNIHFVVPTEKEADALAAGGFRFVRMDFAWGGIERTKGAYDFSSFDKLVDAMTKRGIRLLFILDYENKLYDGGKSPCTPEGRAAFAAYAAAAAAHYAGKGILWEIWNEPNISFWKPKPNANDYAALALATIEAVRKADPQAFIMGPASSEFPWEFFEVLGERGVLAQLDAVTVHPYRQRPPETVEEDYLRLRALLDRYSPKRTLPILSGEWGFSTAWAGMTEEKQPPYLARQWLTNMACLTRLSIWYDWRDDGPDPKEPEHHFGTVFRDMKPKPTYVAAQTLAHTLRGYRFVRRVALESSADYLLLFRKGSETAFAAWTTGDKHRLELPLPAGDVQIVGMLGEKTTGKIENGSLAVELSGSPQYLLLQPSDVQSMRACWSPLDVLLSVRAGDDKELGVAVENLSAEKFEGVLQVTSNRTVLGKKKVNLAAGEQKTFAVPFRCDERNPDGVAALVEFVGPGAPALQATPLRLAISNALRLTVLPWNPGKDQALSVLLANPSGEPLDGALRVDGSRADGARFKLKKGQVEAVVSVPLDAPLEPNKSVRVQCLDGDGKPLLLTHPVDWRALAPLTPDQGQWRAHLDGEAKIAATATAAVVAEVPEPCPQAATHALRLEYRLGAGWRFVRVTPPAGWGPMEGRPVELGMWVFGDGSGNLLRCRFTDSASQTFQPHYGPVDWKGWHFVSLPLSGKDAGHWGGPNDGVIHYPIRWDTVLLIDSCQLSVDTDLRLFATGFALRYE